MELENFSDVKPEAIRQEFLAHLVMCNLLALHMHGKEGAWNPDDIPKYRLNLSVLFGVMKEQLFLRLSLGITLQRPREYVRRTLRYCR